MVHRRAAEDETAPTPAAAMAADPGGFGMDPAVEAPDASASLWVRLRFWLSTLPHIPLPFLGLGVYRAWLNVVLGGGAFFGTSGVVVSQNVFDFAMIAVLLLCAFGTRHITPLYRQGALKKAKGLDI